MKIIIPLCILFLIPLSYSVPPPSLLAAQVIFRHGARTIENTYPSDPYNDESLWYNGFSQLTCRGKVQCYNLGRYLRLRYDNFINSTDYVKKEVQTLSSDLDRTIQSAYSVLAGFYPPNDLVEGEDCDSIIWMDVPVHTIPFEFDNIVRQENNCPRYFFLKDQVYSTSKEVQDLFTENIEILMEFAQNAKFSLANTSIPVLSKYFDALIQERYLNLTLPDWAIHVVDDPGLREVGFFYFHSLTYNEEMKRLRAGPLLNRILHNFNLTLNGKVGTEDGRKIYLISGHDHTQTSFLDTLKLYSNQTRHNFASAVIIELHEIDAQLQIKVFYKNGDEESEEELEIPDCPRPCLYSTFQNIIDPYQINYDDWTQECFKPGSEKSLIVELLIWTLILLGGIVIFAGFVIICKNICKRKQANKYEAL